MLLTTALLLGGCNMVHTSRPLFGPEDAAGPSLRPGVWLVESTIDGVKTPPCGFDVEKPVRRWPACASWTLVRERDLLSYDRTDPHHPVWISSVYVLVGGEPRILQTTTPFIVAVDGKPLPYDEHAVATSNYAAVTPQAENQGFITAYRTWEAQCGPPDQAKYPEGSGPHPSTLEPLQGLAMDDDGQGCSASDREAVRRSVAASLTWEIEHRSVRWLRDARPDDFVSERRRK